jgi:hypothetical protein
MTFKLAINMPGAISAGAYTAGVLDFLTEALDAWYEAKRDHECVPAHDISIESLHRRISRRNVRCDFRDPVAGQL